MESVLREVEGPVQESWDDQTETRWSVLLVDDDMPDVQRVTLQLQRCGACGDMAHCARLDSALALLQAQTFDVVIADLYLPDVRGLDAVDRLRAAAPEAALIALSTGHDEAFDQQLQRVGAQQSLVKGQFDPETLRRNLFQAIARKRHERQP